MSGQISDLQDRSKQLDSKLKSRRVSSSAKLPSTGPLITFRIENRAAFVKLDYRYMPPSIANNDDSGHRHL